LADQGQGRGRITEIYVDVAGTGNSMVVISYPVVTSNRRCRGLAYLGSFPLGLSMNLGIRSCMTTFMSSVAAFPQPATRTHTLQQNQTTSPSHRDAAS